MDGPLVLISELCRSRLTVALKLFEVGLDACEIAAALERRARDFGRAPGLDFFDQRIGPRLLPILHPLSYILGARGGWRGARRELPEHGKILGYGC
jgi:hypothetical protein